MQTVHLLQIAALAGALLFFLSGLLVHRYIAGSRQPAGYPPQRSPESAGDVSKLAAAVELLESKLGDAELRAREAEENVRALNELVASQPSAGGRGGSVTKAERAAPAASDDVQRLQGALSELEAELQDARSARKEAEENVRALQELVRQQQASGGATPAKKSGRAAPAASDDVQRMQGALSELENELQDARSARREAEENVRALQDLVRQLQASGGAAPAKKSGRAAPAPAASDDVQRMQGALSELENELQDARSARKEAEENVRALQDLVRQLQASGGAAPAKKRGRAAPAASDDVQRMQGALSELENELQDARSARKEAEENVRALQDLVRQLQASGGAPAKPKAKSRRGSEDEVTQMASALAQLEETLAIRQDELQDAREKMAAMEELLRQQGA
jgi:exonuclease SbcC